MMYLTHIIPSTESSMYSLEGAPLECEESGEMGSLSSKNYTNSLEDTLTYTFESSLPRSSLRVGLEPLFSIHQTHILAYSSKSLLEYDDNNNNDNDDNSLTTNSVPNCVLTQPRLGVYFLRDQRSFGERDTLNDYYTFPYGILAVFNNTRGIYYYGQICDPGGHCRNDFNDMMQVLETWDIGDNNLLKILFTRVLGFTSLTDERFPPRIYLVLLGWDTDIGGSTPEIFIYSLESMDSKFGSKSIKLVERLGTVGKGKVIDIDVRDNLVLVLRESSFDVFQIPNAVSGNSKYLVQNKLVEGVTFISGALYVEGSRGSRYIGVVVATANTVYGYYVTPTGSITQSTINLPNISRIKTREHQIMVLHKFTVSSPMNTEILTEIFITSPPTMAGPPNLLHIRTYREKSSTSRTNNINKNLEHNIEMDNLKTYIGSSEYIITIRNNMPMEYAEGVLSAINTNGEDLKLRVLGDSGSVLMATTLGWWWNSPQLVQGLLFCEFTDGEENENFGYNITSTALDCMQKREGNNTGYYDLCVTSRVIYISRNMEIHTQENRGGIILLVIVIFLCFGVTLGVYQLCVWRKKVRKRREERVEIGGREAAYAIPSTHMQF